MSAELAARSQSATSLARLMASSAQSSLAQRRLALDALGSRRCLVDPLSTLRDRANELAQAEGRLHDAIPRALAAERERTERAAARLGALGPRITRPAEAAFARLAASLDALSPLSVLSRGYAIAKDAADHVVKDASELAVGDEVRVLLGRGSFDAIVQSIHDEGSLGPEGA